MIEDIGSYYWLEVSTGVEDLCHFLNENQCNTPPLPQNHLYWLLIVLSRHYLRVSTFTAINNSTSAKAAHSVQWAPEADTPPCSYQQGTSQGAIYSLR